METIKNLLKPGGNNDNEQLYGSGVDPNKGKVAGEGTHFGHSHTDSGVGGVSSPTTANNPATGLTGSSATKTAEPSSSNVPIGTATTTGEREFPLSNTAAGSTSDPHSQAGVAGQDYSNVNRTAQAVPATSAATTTTTALSATSTANPTASSVPQTSSVGATGAVQEGTAPASQISSSRAQEIYSPAQPADDKCTDTLHGGSHVTRIAPMIDPCYDQSSTGQTSTTRDADIATAPAVGTAPAAGTTTTQTSSTSHGHSSAVPVAATVGAGAGAGLAGAHAAGEPHSAGQTNVTDLNNREPRQSATAASTVPTSATSGVAGTTAGTTAAVAHPYSEKAVDPRIDNAGSANAQKYHTLDPKAGQRAEPVSKDQEHHYARDAAAGGAAGAGAGALAGHEFSKKDAEKQAEQEQKHAEKLQKEHEKDVKHAEKEHEKEVKHAQKEHEKEVKHAEKEQKQAEKQAEKEHKQAEKEAEKAHKEAEKEQKQAEKAEKPSLIDRILHRGDAKKDTHEEQKAAAVGAGTGAAAATTTHDHHNKLHKDPPAGYADAPNKGYASQVTGGTGTTALASGNPVIPADATVPGTRYGSGHDEHISPATSTQPEHHLNDPSYGVKRDSVSVAGGTVQSTTPYQPAPQAGYASQVTGGTGTTQLAQGNRDPVTNPTKSDPLKEPEHGALGYASTVTGGTGTTQLAQGTTSAVPTEGLVPGRSGSVAGVTTETPYVDGPKAGTGKYAEGVTGGTGTTQLAQGQLDEVANPRKKSVAEKIEDALVMR